MNKIAAKKYKLGAILSIFLMLWGLNVAADPTPENLIRANLTLNFARFSSVSANLLAASGKTLHLCLLGDPSIEEAFATLNGKTIEDKIIQVDYLNHFNNLETCQILYVSNLDKKKLTVLMQDVARLPILTIGEDANFLQQGGMVSLENSDGKMAIFINLKAAIKSKINISARVLNLATVIQ